jgi:hypothetical protein
MNIYHGLIRTRIKNGDITFTSLAIKAKNLESAFEIMDRVAKDRWSGNEYIDPHVDRNTVCQIPDAWIDAVIEARNP